LLTARARRRTCIHLQADFVLHFEKANNRRVERGNGMNTVQLPSVSIASEFDTRSPEVRSEAKLQDLIPIAMVIVGGCETCAEKMVTRALEVGASWQDVDKTLRIVAGTQRLDCFARAVGPEIVARMDKPLAAGRKTLEQAIVLASK